MASPFDRVPYEILDLILSAAAARNLADAVTFSYGLTEAPQPLQHVKLERYVRGRRPEDALRWDAVDSIRQVNATWRHWALDYAVRELYIRRWRGSERWIESRELASLARPPSGQAVYRQPYNAVQETARCVAQCPDLARHVRRLWFHGFYTAETNAAIFQILARCRNLRSVTLPWVALRYGTAERWRDLLRPDGLEALELTAIDLPRSALAVPANQVDHRVLDDPRVRFGHLKKLKIFGNTNFRPVTDDDLRCIARTATGLEALHVTGISSVSIAGIIALVQASASTLRVLEYSPLSNDGFDHPDPDPDPSPPQPHYCAILLACPRLTFLSISMPSICPALFSSPDSVHWTGDLQIRAARICGHARAALPSTQGIATFQRILQAARDLLERRSSSSSKDLDVELFLGPYIFTPATRLVHGDFDPARALSDFSWPSSPDSDPFLRPSSKGPYGQTGLYGKDVDPDPELGSTHHPWSCVGESVFFDGVAGGYVRF
ncbi:hypothetical protein VTN02DRAFT_474 [Thermoascus thermophilus]